MRIIILWKLVTNCVCLWCVCLRYLLPLTTPYGVYTLSLTDSSLLTKIADTLSTIQQPLPSAPAPLPPLPPFDPSALLNTLTSQGVSLSPHTSHLRH